MPQEASAADDIANAVIGSYEKINAIPYGEITFTIQDGRLVAMELRQTLRVGKEIARDGSLAKKSRV